MKIEIFKTVRTKEIIDIEFPHYFVNDISGDGYDSVVYGKLEKDRCVMIHMNYNYRRDEKFCKIEISKRNIVVDVYFNSSYESSEEEFLNAKKELFEFMEEIDNNE